MIRGQMTFTAVFTAFTSNNRFRTLQSICSSYTGHMRSSIQESGKRHETQLKNVLSIKLHNKSWAAKGCPGFVVELNT